MDIEQLRQLTKKYLDGTATPEEKALLDNWYYSFEGKEIVMPGNRAEGHRLAKKIKKSLGIGQAAVKTKRFYYAAAASIVLLAAGWLLQPPAKQHAAVPVAQRRYLTLPDSTKVWLNAESTLDYPRRFGDKTREVTLKGEAFFDVAHDSLHPFVIQAQTVTITVIGTAFNIKAYPGIPVAVTVARGKVKVEDNRKHVLYITPGQQAVSANDLLAKKEVRAALFDRWTEGSLDFEDESFESIALVLHRQFNIAVAFKDTSLQQLRFTAGFDKGTSPEKILDILSKVNGTGWVKENGIFYITQ